MTRRIASVLSLSDVRVSHAELGEEGVKPSHS